MLARLSALIGFLGVGLGAIGAHALEDKLIANDRVETWNTGVLYHLVHALALLVITYRRDNPPKGPWIAWALGIVLFSGNLYILSLTDIGVFGAMVVLGGVSFLVGWAWLIIKPR